MAAAARGDHDRIDEILRSFEMTANEVEERVVRLERETRVLMLGLHKEKYRRERLELDVDIQRKRGEH